MSEADNDKLEKLYQLSLGHGRDLGRLEGRFVSFDSTVETLNKFLTESKKHQQVVTEKIGEIEGEISFINRNIVSLDAAVESVRAHQGEQGVKIATIEGSCYRHGVESEQRDKKISSLWKAVKLADDTGVHHIAEEQARVKAEKLIDESRWNLVKTIAACIVGGVSLISMVISIMNAIK